MGYRESELESVGAVVTDAGIDAADDVEATLGACRVRWSWGWARVARIEGFDRWGTSTAAEGEAWTGAQVRDLVARVTQ